LEGSIDVYRLANSLLGNTTSLESSEIDECEHKEEQNVEYLHPSVAIIYHNIGLVYQDMG
jgi:hypothetical protein